MIAAENVVVASYLFGKLGQFYLAHHRDYDSSNHSLLFAIEAQFTSFYLFSSISLEEPMVVFLGGWTTDLQFIFISGFK